MLDRVFNNVYALGRISNKEGRVLLFTEICKLEEIHIRVFFALMIEEISKGNDRNDSNAIVGAVNKMFREYNEELIELMRYDAFPRKDISDYLEFKKEFIDTILEYLQTLTDVNNKIKNVSAKDNLGESYILSKNGDKYFAALADGSSQKDEISLDEIKKQFG
jgi:hypothetical protein